MEAGVRISHPFKVFRLFIHFILPFFQIMFMASENFFVENLIVTKFQRRPCMDHNRLKGTLGDCLNAILSAASMPRGMISTSFAAGHLSR